MPRATHADQQVAESAVIDSSDIWMTLHVDMTLKLSLTIAEVTSPEDCNFLQDFEVMGPPEIFKILEDCTASDNHLAHISRLRGFISPRSKLSLSREGLVAAGIPPEAVSYSFAYPLPGLIDHLQNLMEHGHHEPWLFFCLLGGFLYFDENDHLVQTNAFTLNHTRSRVTLLGPRRANDAAVLWLDQRYAFPLAPASGAQSPGHPLSPLPRPNPPTLPLHGRRHTLPSRPHRTQLASSAGDNRRP